MRSVVAAALLIGACSVDDLAVSGGACDPTKGCPSGFECVEQVCRPLGSGGAAGSDAGSAGASGGADASSGGAPGGSGGIATGGNSGAGGSGGASGGVSGADAGDAGLPCVIQACAQDCDDLVFWATLDDDKNLTAGGKGYFDFATWTGPAPSAGKCGKAFTTSSLGQKVSFRETEPSPSPSNIDFKRGTLDFFFRSKVSGKTQFFSSNAMDMFIGDAAVTVDVYPDGKGTPGSKVVFKATNPPKSDASQPWLHLVFSWDFTAPNPNDYLKIYYDGAFKGFSKTSGATPFTMNAEPATASALEFGALSASATLTFDEIRIYSRVLVP